MADTRAADSKERILQGATKVFAEKGYLGASMTDVERASDVRRGTLYYHIANKEALLFEVCDRLMTAMVADWQDVMSANVDSEERVRLFGRLMMRQISHNRQAIQVFFRDWVWLEGDLRAQIEKSLHDYEQGVMNMLAGGVAENRFSMSGRLPAYGLLGLFIHAYTWFDPDGPATAEEVADQFSDLVLNGLLVRK